MHMPRLTYVSVACYGARAAVCVCVCACGQGITFETMPNFFDPNVDVISRGSLTQGA